MDKAIINNVGACLGKITATPPLFRLDLAFPGGVDIRRGLFGSVRIKRRRGLGKCRARPPGLGIWDFGIVLSDEVVEGMLRV